MSTQAQEETTPATAPVGNTTIIVKGEQMGPPAETKAVQVTVKAELGREDIAAIAVAEYEMIANREIEFQQSSLRRLDADLAANRQAHVEKLAELAEEDAAELIGVAEAFYKRVGLGFQSKIQNVELVPGSYRLHYNLEFSSGEEKHYSSTSVLNDIRPPRQSVSLRGEAQATIKTLLANIRKAEALRIEILAKLERAKLRKQDLPTFRRQVEAEVARSVMAQDGKHDALLAALKVMAVKGFGEIESPYNAPGLPAAQASAAPPKAKRAAKRQSS